MKAVAKAALGRPSAYNREDIVDCALQLLARDGVQALTLRGIARELGCVLGTINYHFDNLADLEDAVVARLLERLPVLDPARPEPLREQLVELGLAYIDIHSTHPYVRHAAGPVSVEIGARQLLQERSALQTLGLSEQAALLCLEVVSGLAHNRGTEIHRLRKGGESAWRLSEQLSKKVGQVPDIRLTRSSLTAKNMEPIHRELLGTAIDTFLLGFGVGERKR